MAFSHSLACLQSHRRFPGSILQMTPCGTPSSPNIPLFCRSLPKPLSALNTPKSQDMVEAEAAFGLPQSSLGCHSTHTCP